MVRGAWSLTLQLEVAGAGWGQAGDCPVQRGISIPENPIKEPHNPDLKIWSAAFFLARKLENLIFLLLMISERFLVIGPYNS